ncbi:MAG TPA: PAS domain S-box protein [Planctomycetota bacterium]|nr:PAS domain S-box protein [Planctomycetota bacterium]
MTSASEFPHPEPDWFRVTLASIGDAVIATDMDGNVTFMNSVAEQLTGWPQAEARGKPVLTVFRIINEYTRKPAVNPIARVIREGVVVGLANHTLLISKQGVESPIEDSAAPITNADGKVIGVVLVFHDVSERKKAETALLESERRFRLMVDAVRDYAIFMLDPLGNVTSWNQGAERLKGYRADEIMGSHFSRFYLPEDVHAGKPEIEIKGAIQDGRFEDEGWRVRKDGTKFWANVILTAIRDESGKLIGFAKVTRDVTERRAAEEKLRQSEERFRLLIESVKDYAIFMLDTQGHVISWNNGAQRIKGYEAHEILGKSLSVFYPPDAPANKVAHELKVATESGRFEEEALRLRKDGTTFWANVVISPIRDGGGKVVGFSKVTRDITERKRAEHALRDANESLERRVRERTAELETANKLLAERTQELETASRMKDEFLATLSHELRTPLMPMLGWTRMLQSGQLDSGSTSRGIQIIEKNVRLQIRIIEDLLDISRIISGKLKLDLRPTGLAQVVEAALDVVRGSAEAKSVHIEFLMPGSVGPVMGDAARLQQVIWNLLSNAIKFTPKGGRVAVELTREKTTAVIRVSDTGEGIPLEYQKSLFQRFTQADGTIRRRHGGLGLGLSIVKHVVELHGGTVKGSSEGAGKGAVFEVRLPLAKTGTAVLQEYPLGDLPASGGELKNVRILVVDDEEDTRDFLTVVLNQFGAVVEAVSSVSAALAVIDEFKPAVILSDIGMPDQDGYDFIGQLRASGINTPAVALTAFARSEDRERALSRGFQAHLAKPIEPLTLVHTVARLAARRDAAV